MIKSKSSNPAQGVRNLPFLIKNVFLFKKNFYHLFLLSMFVLFSFSVNATVYYVSNSGSDSNSGTSESLPWKTIAKVNSFTPKPGDQILFKRGDEWTGNITVKASGTSSSRITYGAYGTGDKPKIYGSEVITGWTKHSGNIYKASFRTDITQLFVNGVKMKLARTTNTGYNIINSVASQTQFSCNTLNAGINYAGATVLLKTENYFSIMRNVTSSSSKTLNINAAPDGTIKLDQGFVLMNKLEFLDSPGEWYYDTASDMVYVWTPVGDSPANYEVRGTTLNEGISILSKNYITINNLNILQQRESGVSISGGYITTDNNLIEGQEGFGIWAESSSSVSMIIQNNTIDAVNGIGIYAWISNSVIKDNTVTNIGVFDKLGLKGTWNDNGGTGMEISGNGNTIEYNRISEINYNGIFWRGKSTLQYNYMKNVCLYKSDGGGIYTGGTTAAGSTVRYNIVDNSVGNKEGGITDRDMSEGIYLDEPSLNIICEYNTVVRCSNSGIFLHRVENHTVRNNTIMDARYGIFAAKTSGTVKSKITGNIIVTNSASDDYEPRQLAVRYASANATFDNNTYVCPFSSDLVFRPSDGSYKNIANWKTFIAGDANSTFIGTALKTGETQEMFYNDTKQTKTFNLGNSAYRDIYGNQVSVSFTLEPFTSKILIKTAAIVTTDTSRPTISSFSISSTSSSLSVSVTSFTATDNIAVTGYMITESSSAPTAANSGWNTSAPTSYSFSSEGTKTLYAWTKDAAGNVSASKSAQVVITLPDVTKPVVSAFTIPATSASLVVAVNSFTASDDKAVTGYMITESSSAPTAANSAWSASAPTSYSFSSEGIKTLYAWTKDAAGNISASKSAQVVISLPDVTKPVVSAFTIPATSASLIVSINSFTASDNKAVTGYMITESSSAPTSGNSGWNATAPTSYSFSSEGTKTLYAWTKDAAGNVSASKSAQVVITLPDVTKPVIISFSIPDTTGYLTIPITSLDAVDDKEVTGYMLTETEICPLSGNSCWTASAPTTYTFSNEELLNVQSSVMRISEVSLSSETQITTSSVNATTKTLYAWTKDAAGNISAALSDDILILLPDVEVPYISSFSVPSSSASLTVSISNFEASDNNAVTGYLLTETPATPNAVNADWKAEVPASYSFTSEGTKTLYAWVKDAAGNVSESATGQLVITLIIPKPETNDGNTEKLGNISVSNLVSTVPNRRAMPVTFYNGGVIESISIYHNGGKGNVLMGVYADNNGVPSTLLEKTEPTVINSAAGWQTVLLPSPVSVSAGQTIWLSWVFENNPGIRYTTGKPGRAQSSGTWSAGMPSAYGSSEMADYNYSVYCTYSPVVTVESAGNAEVYPNISTVPNRRAMPVTFNNGGVIESISIYHSGGKGNVLMGVYADNNGVPSTLLEKTEPTVINSAAGWQTVLLPSPVSVSAGQTIWLSWVFENNPGIRYTTGKPGRAQSSGTWSAGMPSAFGSSEMAGYNYSVYCTYSPVVTVESAGNAEVYPNISTVPNRRAMPVTFNNGGVIESISIYHNGGKGNILMGVYADNNGVPSTLLEKTEPTVISSAAGWQTVLLPSPVSVSAGQTIWLSWVFENNPGIRYTTGKPGRAQSSGTWSAGMPSAYGSSEMADYNYSVYCTFRLFETKEEVEALKSGDLQEEVLNNENNFADEQFDNQLTSATDLFENQKIDMYPNPAINNVTIRFSELPVEGTSITILDMTGRELQSRIVQNTLETLDIQELKQGIYIVRTGLFNNYKTQKLIKR